MSTYGVLGPLSVTRDDGAPVALTGPLQRRLLAALLLRRGRVTSADVLAELVWGDAAPLDAAPLQSLVFRLRQRIGGLPIEHRGTGYVLSVADDDVDVHRFEQLVVGAVACRTEAPQQAMEMLDAALLLWRGEPFDDLVDSAEARVESARLTELRCCALEERFELAIAAGRGAEQIAELEAYVAREPLRERPRGALIEAYVASGRRADALRVYDTYRRYLAAELGVGPSDALRRRHDELLVDGEAGDEASPPHTPPRQRRTVLRRPTSTFVGRDELLTATLASVDAARLTTLVGPGGVGKTRLALEVAHRLDDGRDGAGVPIIFCDLTTATPDTVVDVVIAAADVEGRVGQTDLDRLVEVLRFQHVCVVLDNCEHVIDAAAIVVERLVETTERVVVLATSRERLAVDGERLLPVAPLAHALDTADSITPATQLLVDRVTALTARPPAAADLALLNELAHRLDGLPLALELAAARLQSLTIGEVIDGLDQSITVLHGGRRTVPRHRTVDAALRWSYELLDEPERAALRAAAMFAAPFRAADVAAVLGLDAPTAVERMAALVERSMAQRDGEHLRLLYVVRQFAIEQSSPGELDQGRRRMAGRMVDVTSELHAAVRGAGGSTPIEEYVARIADVRTAMQRSLADDDAATALTILSSLRDLAFNSWSFELAHWGEQAALAGERVGHPLTVDGWAIGALGAWKRSTLDETRRLLSRAEALVAGGTSEETYELLGAQATEDLAHGRLDQAIGRLWRAMELPGVRTDPMRLGEAYGTLVICMAYSHHPDTMAVAEAMMDEVAGSGAAIATAWCWYASGECRLDLDPERARADLERAVAAARAGGSTFVEGIAGASLASLEVRGGNLAAATAHYRWLIPLWRHAGLQSPYWTGMRWVAELLARAGELIGAIRVLGAAMAPGSGHDVFGDDAERLATLRDQLESAVGAGVFATEFAHGTRLDDAAVAEEATAAFDRLGQR